ncbi:hypothetical protein ACN0QO_002781 [Escherichia coli]
MSVSWTKADFFKCALQVNPAGYSKYRGKESLSEDTYNQKLLESCLEATAFLALAKVAGFFFVLLIVR